MSRDKTASTLHWRLPPSAAGACSSCWPLALALGFLIGGLPAAPAKAQAPGPESFAKPPETPLEYWDAIDYLVRTGQAAKAVPYLQAFVESKPTDEDLLKIRDGYGAGSFLRLSDDPATQAYAQPLLSMMTDAAQRQAKDPARLERYTQGMLGTVAEQKYAIEQLRRAGPDAVPPLVRKLQEPGISQYDQARIVDAMSRLDRSAVPALLSVLDSPNLNIAADAATALGRIGDGRALPFLAYPAGKADDNILREPARQAIARITGRSFAGQLRSPLGMLIDEAKRYLTHKGNFESEPVTLWDWQGEAPAPREVTISGAEGELGVRFAKQALELDPQNQQAQTLLVGLAIQKAVEQSGVDRFVLSEGSMPVPGEPGAAASSAASEEPLNLALETGPETLSNVLNLALDENLDDLAAGATVLLSRVSNRNAFQGASPGGPVHPLIRALSSPDRRVEFAAAESLAKMGLRQPFPGCSQVVPILSRFVQAGGSAPRAVVADTNPNRGNSVTATLQELGYETLSALDGREAFREASNAADVELVMIEPSGLKVHGPWTAADLIANLRADSRTANLPILVYGPLGFDDKLGGLVLDSARTAYVVTPTNPNAFGPVLARELERLDARPLPRDAAAAYSQRAAAALGIIGGEPGNPFEGNLATASQPLIRALNGPPQLASLAALALGNVPGTDAQRHLADRVIDPSAPPEVQGPASAALVRSLQRFGPLIEAGQEKALLATLDAASDPERRQALAAVVGALRPSPGLTGPRLRDAQPGQVLAPAPATPAAAPATPPTAPPAPENP